MFGPQKRAYAVTHAVALKSSMYDLLLALSFHWLSLCNIQLKTEVSFLTILR